MSASRPLGIRLLWAATLGVLVLLGPSPAAAVYMMGSEQASGFLLTPAYTHAGTTHDPFALSLSYLRSFDGTRVKADVQIDFLFDAELLFDELERASYRTAVEQHVERIWNDKFVIVDTATENWFPVEIDLTTTGRCPTRLLPSTRGAAEPTR